MAKIQVVFYSMYGHIFQMAEAVAAGASEVAGTEVTVLRVPELVPEEALERAGALAAQQAFAHIPVAETEQLADADAVIFGTPTRFGNMAAQMRNFLDQTTGLWMRGAIIGKVGSVFVSTATSSRGLAPASAISPSACEASSVWLAVPSPLCLAAFIAVSRRHRLR